MKYTQCCWTALPTFCGARNTHRKRCCLYRNRVEAVRLGRPGATGPGVQQFSIPPRQAPLLLILGALLGSFATVCELPRLTSWLALLSCVISMSCTFLLKCTDFPGSLLDMVTGRPAPNWKWQLNFRQMALRAAEEELGARVKKVKPSR